VSRHVPAIVRHALALAGLVVVLLASGCGLGLMQTGKTTAPGTWKTRFGGGYLHNEMVAERGRSITNYPVQIGWRYGVNEQTDVGAELLMGGGAQLDGKHNLRPSTDPLAVAVQAGAGAAHVLGTNAEIAQVPVRGIVSYDLGEATPYLGLGLEVVWIFGYESDNPLPPGAMPVGRRGHGDGNLTASAGIDLTLGTNRHMLLELAYRRPVFDDPGDGFSFVDNFVFLFGLRN
jgi:opacity protein-like surface antigen